MGILVRRRVQADPPAPPPKPVAKGPRAHHKLTSAVDARILIDLGNNRYLAQRRDPLPRDTAVHVPKDANNALDAYGRSQLASKADRRVWVPAVGRWAVVPLNSITPRPA